MIQQQDLDAIVSLVEQQGLSESVITGLRDQYSDYHFTYCMDDDMDAYTPALERDGFNIYFVNSANHCATLTQNQESASGLVFAEILDDD